MGVWKDNIYFVEYRDLNESRVAEVDALIATRQEQVDEVDWDTTEQWTVGFDKNSNIVQLEAWGITSDGSFEELVFR